MNKALWKKNLHDGMLLFLSIAVAIGGFAWFRVKIVGKLDSGRFKQIIDLLPSDWQRFASVDFDWMISYLGRTATTLDEPMLIMLISLWAIVRGSDVVSGGLGRGTLEMILSQPVGRKRYYFVHNAITVIGLVILSLLVWLGMLIAVETVSVKESVYPEIAIPLTGIRIPITALEPTKVLVPLSDHVDPFDFWPGILNLFCFGFFLTGLSAWMSSLDRFRWRTLGILIAIYFGSAMAKIGSMASEPFSFLKYITYFSFYDAVLFIQQQHDDKLSQLRLVNWTESGGVESVGPLGCNLILLVLGCVLLFTGARVFHRRDLPAPV